MLPRRISLHHTAAHFPDEIACRSKGASPLLAALFSKQTCTIALCELSPHRRNNSGAASRFEGPHPICTQRYPFRIKPESICFMSDREALLAHVASASRPIDAEFEAFNGATQLPFVRAAQDSEVHVFGSFCISEPTELTSFPSGPFNFMSASLSAEGFLCFFDGVAHELHIFSIARETDTVIPGFATEAFVATAGGRIFVGCKGACELLHAPIAAVLERPELVAFVRAPVPEISSTVAATDRAQATGVLRYASSGAVVTVELASMAATSVHFPLSATWLCSTTSLPFGDAVAIGAGGDKHTNFAIRMGADLSSTRLKRRLRAAPVVVFPSRAAPDDPQLACFLDWSFLVDTTQKRHELQGLVQPQPWQSVCRLAADVFVFFDALRARWVACRMWAE
eukprot:gnl/Chilomastix_cuspidata/2732.p1 GENE.gnl/Chilomastix_cuspidata/2732~~gnl/Chilomastix_cuspidata/2732.p1  ORF type:complete len:397 (-),score=92.28 gnl/Chilomastix_cuspidata/2732:62-1252(-)